MNTLTASTSCANELICSNCKTSYSIHEPHSYAPCCTKPLLVTYNTRANPEIGKDPKYSASMWRYSPMLPVFDPENIVSLGEGMTPIIPFKQLSKEFGFESLALKDESLNPTGSFKARGLSMAISKAKEHGITHCVIPTAGNAGGAMSAYCATAGIKATVVMPAHTPQIFQQECLLYGAELILIEGLIDACGARASEIEKESGAFNISTLKEPYRLEGKKTMGYEIAEQMGWKLPDVILYPTGGGTGLIGIWKAFQEMTSLGWLEANVKLPRMIAVQAENCCPVVDHLNGVERSGASYKESIANGLAVPFAFGLDIITQVIQESGGTSITVSEKEMEEGMLELAAREGMLIAPEGAALWKALQKLTAKDEVSRSENILMINTGSGYKYLENLTL